MWKKASCTCSRKGFSEITRCCGARSQLPATGGIPGRPGRAPLLLRAGLRGNENPCVRVAEGVPQKALGPHMPLLEDFRALALVLHRAG